MRALTPIETRVLATLMEKARTVPDSYPLSLNALVLGCNQKTSRDPVMEVSDDDTRTALEALKAMSLVFEGSSSRVPRYEHNFQRASGTSEQQSVLLGLLMLRGPQTPAELRTASERWYRFADALAVDVVLQELADRGDDGGAAMVLKLARAPGAREQRWVHLLSGEVDVQALVSNAPSTAEAEGLLARVTALENALVITRAENTLLKAHIRTISEQLGITLPEASD
jgi:uncharacterized protein